MAAGQTGSRTPEGGPPPGDLTAGSGRSLPVLETFVLLVVTLPLAVVFHLPTLWFVIPFVVITARGRNYEDYGLTWRNPGTWRFHAVVILLVFGTYLAGHYLFGRLVLLAGLSRISCLPSACRRNSSSADTCRRISIERSDDPGALPERTLVGGYRSVRSFLRLVIRFMAIRPD